MSEKSKPQAEAIEAAVQAAADLAPPRPDLSDPGQALTALGAQFGERDSSPPKGPAAMACERLILYIRHFEQTLNASEEVVLGFAGSEVGILKIEGLGFYDPDIITFYGRDEAGMKTQCQRAIGDAARGAKAKRKRPRSPHRLSARGGLDGRRGGGCFGLTREAHASG
jgi:hypothetical protein